MWGRRPALINPASSPGPGPPVSGSGLASKWMERVCPSSPLPPTMPNFSRVIENFRVAVEMECVGVGREPRNTADKLHGKVPGLLRLSGGLAGEAADQRDVGRQAGTGQVAQDPAGGLEIYPLAHPAQHLLTSRFQAEKDAIQTGIGQLPAEVSGEALLDASLKYQARSSPWSWMIPARRRARFGGTASSTTITAAAPWRETEAFEVCRNRSPGEAARRRPPPVIAAVGAAVPVATPAGLQGEDHRAAGSPSSSRPWKSGAGRSAGDRGPVVGIVTVPWGSRRAVAGRGRVTPLFQLAAGAGQRLLTIVNHREIHQVKEVGQALGIAQLLGYQVAAEDNFRPGASRRTAAAMVSAGSSCWRNDGEARQVRPGPAQPGSGHAPGRTRRVWGGRPGERSAPGPGGKGRPAVKREIVQQKVSTILISPAWSAWPARPLRGSMRQVSLPAQGIPALLDPRQLWNDPDPGGKVRRPGTVHRPGRQTTVLRREFPAAAPAPGGSAASGAARDSHRPAPPLPLPARKAVSAGRARCGAMADEYGG